MHPINGTRQRAKTTKKVTKKDYKMDKLLSIRIRRNGFIGKQVGANYYKSFAQQREHDFRKETMTEGYLINPNNENIFNEYHAETNNQFAEHFWISAKDDYKERWGRAMPQNTKPIISGVISFSSTMQQDAVIYGVKRLNDVVSAFLRMKFGTSLMYSVMHNDETTPHFHFQAINFDFRTHKSFSNQTNTSTLQDELADFTKSKISEFEYKRGIPKDESGAEHLEVRKSQLEAIKRNDATIKAQEAEIAELRAERLLILNSFNEIIEDILKLGEKETAEQFLKDMQRLVQGDARGTRLEKLLEKAERAKKAITRKSSPTMV